MDIDFQPLDQKDTNIDFQPMGTMPHTQPIRESIEPGIMGETQPIEQKLLANTTTALSGATLPSAITGLAKAGLGTLGQYAKRFGQNQAMKSLGAAGGQIGQVGIPESRAIAQSMIDQGVISPLRGPIGAEEMVKNLHETTGADIGAARQMANTRGEAPQMAEILQQVKQNLEPKYASGVNKAPALLNRAREEIAKGGTGTFTGNAQKATDLNAAAAANKLYRPQGATTDVADTITQMNKAKMQSLMTPEEWGTHEKDLANYGPLGDVKEFMKRGERKEMTGRAGGSLTKAIADKTMDALGNRTAATIGSGLGDVLQAAATTPLRPPSALAAYLMRKYQENQ